MKYNLFLPAALFLYATAMAGDKDSTRHYMLPDSVKATSFLADINVQSIPAKKEAEAGIRTELVQLYLEAEKEDREIVFAFPSTATIVATGKDVKKDNGELEWEYDWATGTTYKLLIAMASDSAGNFSLYSGYVWLPSDNKWKLIGTCRISGQSSTIKDAETFYSAGNKQLMPTVFSNPWSQRLTGSWKSLNGHTVSPTVNLFSHVDSVWQLQKDKQLIEQAVKDGKIEAALNKEDVYYVIQKEGTGRQVSVDDTVTVNYRLTLLGDGTVVDETKDKPATFPLKRLIKGWQIGVPLSKTGGRIKLVIPSSLAYSIRTRAAKIPPNSILVFEIEVLDAKL